MNPDLIAGWPYVAHESTPPADHYDFGAALLERVLITVFNSHTEAEACQVIAAQFPRIDIDKVLALRELGAEVAAVEWAMPETTWVDHLLAVDDYESALRQLSASLMQRGAAA